MFLSKFIKRISIVTLLALSVVAFGISNTFAQSNFNKEINYQGKLTDSAGATVADGSYNMRFWLLTSPSVATTSAIWTESLTGSNRVPVTSGLFSVMLGSTSPLTSVDFNQTLYLGVEIGGTGGTPTWDGEMSPRKIIGAVPAAFEADNANTVGGVASTSFIRSDVDDTAAGLLTLTGGLISNASSTLANLNFTTATGTTIIINNEAFTDFTGTALVNNAGVLSVSTSSLAAYFASTTNFDTSAELAAILTDETGTGNVVFSDAPTFTGTADFVAGDFSSTLTLSGTAANIALGTNFLSGDGGDEGVFVSSTGDVGIGTSTLSSKLTVSGTSLFDTAFTTDLNLTGSLTTRALRIAPGTALSDTYFLENNSISVTGSNRLTGTIYGSYTNIQYNNTAVTGGDTFITGDDITIENANTGSTSVITGQNIYLDTTNGGEVNAMYGQLINLAASSGIVNEGYGIFIESATNISNAFGIYQNGANDLNYFAGKIGIATDTPAYTLTVDGDIMSTGALYDNANSAGSNGMVLQSTGTGFTWVATSTLGLGGGGATTLDGLSDVDTTGVSGGDILTFNGSSWVDFATSTFLMESELNTEAELEALLGDVTDVFTSNANDITSAELITAVSDETGSGNLVFSTSPTFTGTTNFASLIASASSTLSLLNFTTATGTTLVLGGDTITDINGTGLSLTAGVLSTTLGTSIDESELNISGSPTDGYVLQASSTAAGGFVWVATSTLGLISTANIDTSAELAAILTDETGTGNAVFSASPTFTGTLNAAAATLSSTLTLSGTAANIALGSNWLSGDGDDEGVFVSSTGNVGIGTSSPTGSLTIQTTNNGSMIFYDNFGEFEFYRNEDTSSGPLINFYKSRGTKSNPTVAQTDDQLFTLNGRGYRGAGGYNLSAEIVAKAEANFTNVSTPTYISFNTTPSGSISRSERLRISSNGNVGVGTTSPARTLSVAGSVYATGALYGNNGSAGTNGMVLQTTGSGFNWVATSTLGLGGSSGTVSSVALTAPASFSVSGSPITTSGTLALTYAAGYEGLLTASSTNWNSFYDTPSTRITDGTGLTWSGNTLNLDNDFGATIDESELNIVGSPTDGYVMQASSTSAGGFVWVATSTLGLGGGGATTLDALTDVDTTGVASGDILAFNGTTWVDFATSTFLMESELNTESKLETLLGGLDVVTITTDDITSANLATALSNETGTGNVVFSDAPTFTGTTNLASLIASASSTLAQLNFTTATGTTLVLGGDTITDINGTGLSLAAGVLSTTLGTSIDESELNISGSPTDGHVLQASSTAAGGLAWVATSTLGFAASTDLANYLPLTGGTLSGNLSFSGTTANIALGSNWLSGDGDDEGVFVSSTGNVGLGTSSPASKLDVWGNLRVGTSSTPALLVNTANGRVALGTTTPESILSIGNTGLTGSVTGGINSYIGLSNSTLDAVQYGDRSYININSTATSTVVGGIIRLADNTTLGNVVRGFEVQAFQGANTQGENTALSGFARTFGVRGKTEGDAGALYEPAGGFFETGGTTQGNAIRGYSASITTAEMLALFQEDSTFAGTGLLMNFGNDTGSFSSTTSKFVDFQNAGTSKFTVSAHGTTTIGDGTTSNQAGLQIGYGGLCVDNDGSCNASTTGRISSVSSYTGNSDLAEMYFSSQDLKPGEIVVTDGFLSVRRATEDTNEQVLGVVSTKPGLLLGFDDSSLITGQQGYPLALSGRVPVRLSDENGPIAVGDPLTLSSLPGVAMKATEADMVVGYALESYDGTHAYTEGFVDQFGDDIAEPNYEAINVNTDDLLKGSCYFGGGVATGEVEPECEPVDLDIITAEKAKEEAIAKARFEAEQAALLALRNQPAESIDIASGTVNVGQIIMFVDRGYHQLASQTDLLNELVSTSSDLVIGAKAGSNETLWSRLRIIAQNFVDGVLTIAGIKAEKVETKELCVDDVCIDATGLRALLQASNNSGQVIEVVSPPSTAINNSNPPVSSQPNSTSDASTTPITASPEIADTASSTVGGNEEAVVSDDTEVPEPAPEEVVASSGAATTEPEAVEPEMAEPGSELEPVVAPELPDTVTISNESII